VIGGVGEDVGRGVVEEVRCRFAESLLKARFTQAGPTLYSARNRLNKPDKCITFFAAKEHAEPSNEPSSK
jgi:hypothetical protein